MSAVYSPQRIGGAAVFGASFADGAPTSSVSGNATLAGVTAAGTLSSVAPPATGTITSEPLYNNVGVLQVSKALNHYSIYNNTTGALVLRKTGLSTNGSGIVTFTDALAVTSTTYRHDWETTDGTRCMPQKAAA